MASSSGKPPPPAAPPPPTSSTSDTPLTPPDDAPPNFFCRPGRSRRKPTTMPNAQTTQDGDSVPLYPDDDEEIDPPRLAFVHAIVDHHTRAREARHQRARLDASTNAWNVPLPAAAANPRRADTDMTHATTSASASTSYSSSSARSTGFTDATGVTSPSASPPSSPRKDDPSEVDGQDTQHKHPQHQAEPEEELPWFSQLASLPHLRSAGIPLLQPVSQSSNNGSTNIPGGGSTSTDGNHHQQQISSSTSTSSTGTPASSSLLAARPTPAPPPPPDDLSPLVPPDNFAMVNSWLYRSSFPKKKHFPFLKTLGLKSVLTLILEEYPAQNTKFLDDQGITFFQFGIPGNKEPFVQIPSDKIASALLTMLDRRNHPMLIHCNKGKHRTGCLIGCLRKLQDWSLTIVFDEYRRFSHPKSRSMDQEFIELFDVEMVWSHLRGDKAKEERKWLPRWRVVQEKKRQIEQQGQGAKISVLEEEEDGDEGNTKLIMRGM